MAENQRTQVNQIDDTPISGAGEQIIGGVGLFLPSGVIYHRGMSNDNPSLSHPAHACLHKLQRHSPEEKVSLFGS